MRRKNTRMMRVGKYFHEACRKVAPELEITAVEVTALIAPAIQALPVTDLEKAIRSLGVYDAPRKPKE